MTTEPASLPATGVPAKRSRAAAGALYVAAALALAGIMTLIGRIPTDSGRTRIIYESFGGLSVATIVGFIYQPNPQLGLPPPWVTWALILGTAALYTLLLTLPFYFYFRRRERLYLALAALSIAAHLAFARWYVAPFWIHQ